MQYKILFLNSFLISYLKENNLTRISIKYFKQNLDDKNKINDSKFII